MYLDLREVEGEIAELERSEINLKGVCALAALYTIRGELTGHNGEQQQAPQAYYSPPEEPYQELEEYGDSEFLRAVAGKDAPTVWSIMDDLMDTLKVVNIKVYNSVISKIKKL